MSLAAGKDVVQYKLLTFVRILPVFSIQIKSKAQNLNSAATIYPGTLYKKRTKRHEREEIEPSPSPTGALSTRPFRR